jgi:Protein of unknown function (DUF1580)
MFNSKHENIITLYEAVEYAGQRSGGINPSLQTIRRWCRSGFRGVILESEKRGNPRVTSREAIDRFFDRISTPLSTPLSNICEPSVESLEAERQLKAMGF